MFRNYIAATFLTFAAADPSEAGERRTMDFFCVNFGVAQDAAVAVQNDDKNTLALLATRPLQNGCRYFSKLWGARKIADVERIELVYGTDFAIGVAHLSNDWIVFVLIKENLL
jgi:hypothetical protein